MKQKLTSFILLIAISLLALVSCGSGAAKYRNDVAVPDLCAAADPLIGDSSTMATMTDDYLYGMMGIELDGISDYAVKVQASGANVDEYGIFKASSEDGVAAVEQMVQSYLSKLDARIYARGISEGAVCQSAGLRSVCGLLHTRRLRKIRGIQRD